MPTPTQGISFEIPQLLIFNQSFHWNKFVNWNEDNHQCLYMALLVWIIMNTLQAPQNTASNLKRKKRERGAPHVWKAQEILRLRNVPQISLSLTYSRKKKEVQRTPESGCGDDDLTQRDWSHMDAICNQGREPPGQPNLWCLPVYLFSH